MTDLEKNCLELKEGFNYRGLDWVDSTTYSREQKVRIPTTFTSQVDRTKITVTCGHLSFRPSWVFHCYDLGFDTKNIGTGSNPKEAIDMALGLCHSRLERLFQLFERTRKN